MIGYNSASSTPKIFIRSTSIVNHGYNNAKTPITTHRSLNESQIGTHLMNPQNVRFYQTFSPAKMYSNLMFNNENQLNYQIESRNYPQISTDSKIDLNGMNARENDILTNRSEKYSYSYDVNKELVFEESLAKPAFSYLTTLPESSLPSTSVSENESNVLNLQKLKPENTESQENTNADNTEERLFSPKSEAVDARDEIEDKSRDDALLPTESQTSMEISITPPESFDLIRRNDFYLSEEINYKNRDGSSSKPSIQRQDSENSISMDEKSTKREKNANSDGSFLDKMRFGHLCTSLMTCLFPWVKYGQQDPDDKPQIIYYQLLDDEKQPLLQTTK